jgi:hypothetical protein
VHVWASSTGGAPRPGRVREIGRVSPPAPGKTESGSSATTSLNFRSSLTHPYNTVALRDDHPTLSRSHQIQSVQLWFLVCRFELRSNFTPAPKGENVPK